MSIMKSLALLFAVSGCAIADECTLVGYHAVYEDVFAGGVTSIETYNGADLYYVGVVSIDGSNGYNMVNLNGITIPAGKLRLPNSLQWKPAFNGFTFSACEVVYEGQTHQGYLKGTINPCNDFHGLGYDCEYCSVDFGCEGGL